MRSRIPSRVAAARSSGSGIGAQFGKGRVVLRGLRFLLAGDLGAVRAVLLVAACRVGSIAPEVRSFLQLLIADLPHRRCDRLAGGPLVIEDDGASVVLNGLGDV